MRKLQNIKCKMYSCKIVGCEMQRLNNFSDIDAYAVAEAADIFETPLYVYDESHILKRCLECLNMPNAYGLTVRYAMKANSNATLLRTICNAGLHLDASSLNEVIRAGLAGISYENIMLTTQEVPEGSQRTTLERLMLQGLKYNVCSLRQLHLIADFAAQNGINPGIRVHPGIGSGESATRNTGDDYESHTPRFTIKGVVNICNDYDAKCSVQDILDYLENNDNPISATTIPALSHTPVGSTDLALIP